jgi:hypothetical protein
VLEALAASKIMPSYIHENKYFMGVGADQNKRLSEAGRLAVINMASIDLEGNAPMTAASFASEYCAPMRHAEQWFANKRQEFGHAADLPAFSRVEKYLMSSRARLPLLQCTRGGIKLDGVSDQQPGIEQCRVLVKELQALKAGPAEPVTRGAPGTDSSLAAGTVTDALVADVGCAVALVAGALEAELDPAKDIATSKADLAMANLTRYESWQSLGGSLASVVMPSSKVMFFVDAPTSKAKVVVALLERVTQVSKLLQTKKFKAVVVDQTTLDNGG